MLKNGRPYTDENGCVDAGLITSHPAGEQKIVAEWIAAMILPAKSRNRNRTSYRIKHILQGDTGIYLTNNEFKDAMLLSGYEPCDPNELNWTYKISGTSNAFNIATWRKRKRYSRGDGSFWGDWRHWRMATTYKTTEAQRASSKRYRERMIAEHRCSHCGRQDARTLAGHTACETCHMKKMRYERTQRADRSELHKEYAKRWRDARRAEHRCTGCGKPLPEGDTHVTCVDCRRKKSGWQVEMQRHRRCSLIKGLSEAEKLQVCLDCPYAECVEGGD